MSAQTESLNIPSLRLEATGPALSPSQLIWRRFRKHTMAMIGSGGFILLLLFILVGSIIIPEQKANEVDLAARLSAPSNVHFMGTDSTGRDIFARIIYGGQISLVVGFLAVLISVTLGTLLGGIAGYFGGWVDSILMRFTEAILSIPQLFLLIVLGKYFGRDIQTITLFGRSFSGSVGIVILVIGVTSWMVLARIVRANVLSLREMEYISASKALGGTESRIFFRHLIPNTMGVIIVASTLGLAGAILNEAYVSFLGLGVQPPTSSWGNMLTSAQSFIQRGAWWMWVFPSLFIIFTILCINLLGDGLRDALDPRSQRHL
ncbi:MAG: ABC transporter permease [Chloroflexi bacterium]|nr:ABC transporter permease [Chloroflexota bacterium]